MLIRVTPQAGHAAARANLSQIAADRGEDMAGLSRMIGRPAAYLSRYVREARPARLREDEQDTLARYFGVPPQILGAPMEV